MQGEETKTMVVGKLVQLVPSLTPNFSPLTRYSSVNRRLISGTAIAKVKSNLSFSSISLFFFFFLLGLKGTRDSKPRPLILQMSGSEQYYYPFGPHKMDAKNIFYTTDLSFAMVNLRPVLPGHVLIIPRRQVKRVVDLTAGETCDLWLTAQKVAGMLESFHKASSLTFTIQDGPEAGQSVPHVHIHIVPRKVGDFENNDDIYDAIDKKEKEMKDQLNLDKERKDRSPEEMAQEADEYRAHLL